MLSELRIRNFAIIESVTLPLAPGFNVLSGETGAGKSIIVGALGFLLGERGSADLIRPGADKATVEGSFDAARRPEVVKLADERGIEIEDGTLTLRREISAAGRGRAWINGTPVTATLLAEIGRSLVNLHGQHESQTLLDAESQRTILDEFAVAGTQAGIVRAAFEELETIRREIASLAARRAAAEKRADYLGHVAKEIDDAKLTDGEDVRLEDEARILENADELRALVASMTEVLSGDDGAITRLGALNRTLQSVQRIDSSASKFQELYDSGFYAFEELSRALDDYAAGVDLDPDRLQSVRTRRDLIYSLIKKYGPSLDTVVETGSKARAELDLLDSSGFDIGQLKERERTATEKWTAGATRLTEVRFAATRKLSKQVDAILPELGMSGGRFMISLTPIPGMSVQGAEDVEFRVALNVGHEARPLARVASGGELSRVMLALKTILARSDSVPTLIFDEVDAGIGGKVGLQVGDTLRRVATHHQVFAISHLPQIAARAHHHIVVAKGAKSGVTTADISVLDGPERVTEIARMLGGDPESKLSRAHAEELLARVAAA